MSLADTDTFTGEQPKPYAVLISMFRTFLPPHLPARFAGTPTLSWTRIDCNRKRGTRMSSTIVYVLREYPHYVPICVQDHIAAVHTEFGLQFLWTRVFHVWADCYIRTRELCTSDTPTRQTYLTIYLFYVAKISVASSMLLRSGCDTLLENFIHPQDHRSGMLSQRSIGVPSIHLATYRYALHIILD